MAEPKLNGKAPAQVPDLPLDVAKEQVLRRDIPWETYMTAKLITPTCFQLLRRYDHRSKELQAGLLEESGPAYVSTFITVLQNVFSEETTEYVLALLYDLLQANPKRALFFYSDAVLSQDAFGPFMRLLSSSNWFILEATSHILALVIPAAQVADASRAPSASSSSAGTSNGCVPTPLSSIHPLLLCFVPWLAAQLQAPAHPTRGVPNAVGALAAVLRVPEARDMFVQAQGVQHLLPLIRPVTSQQHMQLLYEAVLCVWLLSFNQSSLEAISSSRILLSLNEVAKSSSKEKIVRVAVMALNNLMLRGHMGAAMVELGLPKTVASLKLNTWHDDDLKEALGSLEEGLRHNLKVMSSFDKYKQEVMSGSLDWTPMHKDPSFWRENVMQFEENEFQVLRALVALLEPGGNKRTLAVACHDVGMFITAHPSGRNVALDMRAKERVIPLMEDDDSEVRKQALLCIQKLLLSAKYVSYLQA